MMTIHWRNRHTTLLFSLIAVVLSLMVFSLPSATAVEPTTPTLDAVRIYEQVSPSVVAINVVSRQESPFFEDGEGDVFGQGSGFVIDADGHIVTNFHVVDGATQMEVEFFDGTLARAEIIGLDPDSDLAIIQVDLPTEKLFPIEFADSDALVVGEPVFAIGSPFGQRWTITSGIISALDRTIPGLNDNFSIGGVIQTDAAINPGNSGGPLLNIDGQVIGVNSQIRSATRSNSGVGFAVPSNLTQRVAQQLIENGFTSYSYLGIAGTDVNLDVLEQMELANDVRGVVVSDVLPGGPAARAGLEAPVMEEIDGVTLPESVDIITHINGERLTGMAALITYLANNTSPGDNVELTVLRDGTEELLLDVRLMPRP